MLIDTQGQRLRHRDEMLGINSYMAHLGKCVDLARRQGHRINVSLDSLDRACMQQITGRDSLRPILDGLMAGKAARSEERRVGKECRSRWSPYH